MTGSSYICQGPRPRWRPWSKHYPRPKTAAKERTERERQEARVGEVQQELQALVSKHDALERDSKMRESELAMALESAKSAKAEAQKALQEIDAMKKIAAGKAFNMQSKHVKVNYLLLTRVRISPGAIICIFN